MAYNDAVFIDTSFFKAQIDPDDDFHESAAILWDAINRGNKKCFTSNYILDEALTLLRVRCGRETAFRFRDFLNDHVSRIQVLRIQIIDETIAWSWFEKDWNHLSFTDCVTFAQMKRLGIIKVAAFDNHFEKAGFEIVK